MHALILGGAGFVGLHLADRLVADGHRVTIVDDFSRGRDDERIAALRAHPAVDVRSADLTSAASWAGIPRGYDQIYLLAAVVGVRNVEADPARVIRVNTLTALHLLDWLIPGERIFFSSTSEVYAGGVDAGIVPVPTAEDVPVMVSDVTAPRFAYAVSKLLGEAAFVHGARAKECSAVVGRFHNVYGARMGTDHVIPEMALRALRGEDPFRVWGADQYRAFCHVDDAVEAMLRLMACPEAAGEIVHIGDDSAETNIADLAGLVLDLAGAKPTIERLPAPPGSVTRRCPDLGKLRRLTGFEPTVALADGVRRTFDWYRGWWERADSSGPLDGGQNVPRQPAPQGSPTR
ncbi:NAD-dependent epimerase/dehydratase family protein [Micromonospora sp. NPDC050417]|uniref:NAD-dependent epimerase/dehydratase family protein n=1 Tax=Micromonospora sp. NPDC050417 TaxID=3364280 RepID=UPI00378EDB93